MKTTYYNFNTVYGSKILIPLYNKKLHMYNGYRKESFLYLILLLYSNLSPRETPFNTLNKGLFVIVFRPLVLIFQIIITKKTCLTSTMTSKGNNVCFIIIPAVFCCPLYCIIWAWVPKDFPRSMSSTAVVLNLAYSYPSLFISFRVIWSRKTPVFIMNIILQVVRE